MKECNKIIALMLIFVWLTSTTRATCCYTWSRGTTPSGGSITTPPDNAVYLAGDKVLFMCSRATDYDDYVGKICEGSAADAYSDSHPRWTSTSGSFPSGNTGTMVYWQAPDTEEGSIQIKIYDDDRPYTINGCDDGIRDDEPSPPETDFLQHTHTIKTVIPEPDKVSFVDNIAGEEHDIYNVSDPVWKRVSNPDDPASYTKNKYEKLEAEFWDSETLTKSVFVYVDGEAGAWLLEEDTSVIFGASWPSQTTTHRSTNTTDDKIEAYTSTYTWKYKVPSGSNIWNTMTDTSGPHITFAVYGAPTCGASNYTEDNIGDAVFKITTTSGTEADIASNANTNVGEEIFTGNICGDYSWNQINFDAAMDDYPTSPPKGMCCCRAEGLDCVLNVLGIGPYTNIFCNEMPEEEWATDMHSCEGWCTTAHDEVFRGFRTNIWNFWQGAVRSGDTGTTAYAPSGEYVDDHDGIADNWTYRWFYGTDAGDYCTGACTVIATGICTDGHSSYWDRF